MRFFCLLICLFLPPLIVSFLSETGEGVAGEIPASYAASLSLNTTDYVEIDFVKRRITFVHFPLGKRSISGTFSFEISEDPLSDFFHDALHIQLEGKDILIGEKKVSELKLALSKRKNIIFVHTIEGPGLQAKGTIDVVNRELSFNIKGAWRQNSSFLKGGIALEAKIWGAWDDISASGAIEVEEGRYKDTEFAKLSLQFFGKPPSLYITDSRITLDGKDSYEVVGEINLQNFENLLPGADFISRKVSLGEWEFLSEDESAGLRKMVDENVDVVIDTYDEEDEFMGTGAEVRYKVKEDQFLRLRMQQDRAIVGFEKRKEF